MQDAREQPGEMPPGPPCRGFRDLLAAVYDACADDMYRYALMLLADPASAEDAVQQAFLKLCRMGTRALRIESCRDYLRAAVRNECLRILGRRGRQPASLEAASRAHLLEAASDVGLDEDERGRLEAALRELPPEQREVVYLKVYEGRTFQQIGDWTGVSSNTAASRYRYAIDKLRQRMAETDAPGGGST